MEYDEDLAEKYAQSDEEGRGSQSRLQIRSWLEEEVVPILSGQDVLDLGIGTGRWSKVLEDSSRLYGVDASRPMLRRANAKKSRVDIDEYHFLQGASPNIPIVDSTVDIVVSIGVFGEHAPATEESFSDVARVLKPSGQFAFSIFEPGLRRRLWARLALLAVDHRPVQAALQQHELGKRMVRRLSTYESWADSKIPLVRSRLSKAGFEIDSCTILHLTKGKYHFISCSLK